jgi:hypothetical protein
LRQTNGIRHVFGVNEAALGQETGDSRLGQLSFELLEGYGLVLQGFLQFNGKTYWLLMKSSGIPMGFSLPTSRLLQQVLDIRHAI